jgi:hypothetical protein
MPQVPFASLPDPARLWIFAADRTLTPEERSLLAGAVDRGLADWAAHGSPVTWGFEVVRDQFLLIGVDESRTALSGCSIDGAIREIKELESRLHTPFLDHGRVFFRDGDGFRSVPREVFKELAREGRVTADTVVLNNVLATVGEYRRGEWEVPVRRSWHARAFPVGA